MRITFSLIVFLFLSVSSIDAAQAVYPGIDRLYDLAGGKTEQVNALWVENPKELRFGEGRTKVTIADLKGPGVITMIHFALPASMKLERDALLRIYWDGERNPSVESPLVDFFCDPNGALERVDTVLVNKKRGWNCYFPMPFAKSARVEVEVDNPRYPAAPWDASPCYSYVMYRTVDKFPHGAGYFHARWRQENLLLGKLDYEVFAAKGKGQFVGWNVTVRGVGSPSAGYPVDENVNFYVDGEAEPSIEWQGIEDSFGFSWGFPPEGNGFAYTGFQPYYNGAAAYRFTLNDRVAFGKSLRMTVGFGKNESPVFREIFSQPENALEFSSVAYWYQTEPHVPFGAITVARERKPTFPAVARKEEDPTLPLAINCGSAKGDEGFLTKSWDFALKRGYLYSGWPTEINHCWADAESLEFDIICPKGSQGALKLFILDGDNFTGGRKQSIQVAGKLVGEYESFQTGRWVEVPISAADSGAGRIPVVIKNLKPGSNAVVSLVEFRKLKS